MEILGTGVDIVKNSRIKKLIKNKKFLNRIFTKKEIDQSKKIHKKVEFFSKRFAAKEAFSKALGTGFRKNLNFKDICVKNDKLGKPEFLFKKKVKKMIINKFKVKKVKSYLSLSDETIYSIAFVVIEKK